MRDPNEFVDGVPLTSTDILTRIADRFAEIAAIERKREAAKSEAKRLGEDVEAKMEEVADLSSLWKSGRPCYALVSGGVTSETPRNLPLWEAAEKTRERATEQAKADPITSAVYLRFGEGKCDGVAFARVLYPEKCGKAHVQNEGPGTWSAYHNGDLVSKGWRSAADAMLAVLKHAEAEGAEEDGWEAVAKIGPVEPPAGETSTPTDAGAGHVSESSGTAPAPKTRKRKGDEPKKYAPQADDGTIYRATWKGELVAVAQVTAPGPWRGYVAGACRVGEAGDLEHSDAAKLALAEALGVGPKDVLAWASKLSDAAAPAEPAKAPRARRTATK